MKQPFGWDVFSSFRFDGFLSHSNQSFGYFENVDKRCGGEPRKKRKYCCDLF